jgi:hypothetical protein
MLRGSQVSREEIERRCILLYYLTFLVRRLLVRVSYEVSFTSTSIGQKDGCCRYVLVLLNS